MQCAAVQCRLGTQRIGYYGTPERWRALNQRKIDKEGHKGVGYSYLVLQDGSIYLGRGHAFAHGGVSDSATNKANQRSIAIAFDGNMQDAMLPTGPQWAAAVQLVQELMAMYDLEPEDVLGHNEIPTYANGKLTGKTYATLCPCLDMDAFRSTLEDSIIPMEPEIPIEDIADAEPEEGQYEYIGKTYSNIRAKPTTAEKILGQISNGETCIASDMAADKQYTWLYIDTGKITGWCTANYLRKI